MVKYNIKNNEKMIQLMNGVFYFVEIELPYPLSEPNILVASEELTYYSGGVQYFIKSNFKVQLCRMW